MELRRALFAVAACLFSAGALHGAACTASVTGNWSATGTWGGTCAGSGPSGVPGNGDTITVNTGITVTANQNMTSSGCPASSLCIGTSGASTAIAITLNGTGQVSIASGVNLRLRGNVETQSYPTGQGRVNLVGGSVLTIDSTASSSPTTTRYYVGGGNTNNTAAAIVATGTGWGTGQYATVTSDTTGGALPGVVGVANNTWTGNPSGIQATYTLFQDLGDANVAGIRLSPYDNVPFSLTYCRFNRTGGVYPVGSGNPNRASSIYTFHHNQFSNTTAAVTWYSGYSSGGPPNTAVSLTNNVFDKNTSETDLSCSASLPNSLTNFTLSDNFFQGGVCLNGTVRNNFHHDTSNVSITVRANSNVSNSYFFGDIAYGANLHYVYAYGNGLTLDGLVVDVPEDNGGDSGESLEPALAGFTGTFTATNNVVLPTKTGLGWSEMGSFVGDAPSSTTEYRDHNTVWQMPGFGSVQLDEGTPTQGTLYLRSNLIMGGGSGLKVNSTYSVRSTDKCPLARCDYNAGYQVAATQTACTGCTNQANGYGAKFSSGATVAGAHDLDVLGGGTGTDAGNNAANPRMTDSQRRVATAHTLLFGQPVGTAWATSTAYVVGDIVSVQSGSRYGGRATNYRCIAAHTSGASTEPESGASWRTDWEPAALDIIRTATAAGTTYVNPTYGCTSGSPCSVSQYLRGWVRNGVAPTNTAFATAGHDGGVIGAVPVYVPVGGIPAPILW